MSQITREGRAASSPKSRISVRLASELVLAAGATPVRYDERNGLTSEPLALTEFPRSEDLCGEQTTFRYLAPCEIRTFDLFHDDHSLPERVRGVLRTDVAAKEITHALTGAKLGPEAVADRNSPARLDATIVLVERTQKAA